MRVITRAMSVAMAVGLVLGTAGNTAVMAASLTTAPAEARPAELDNFGFPFGFDVSKMDLKADPRKDFRRYAAGRWLDAATIPSDTVRISGIDVLSKRVDVQIQSVLDEAMRASASAVRGSPTQQVGDFYAAGMDEKRLTELGVAPLKPELDRIAAIDGRKSLAIAVPGHSDEAGRTLSFDAAAGVVIPEGFARAIYLLLGPGATMFVTDAPILAENTASSSELISGSAPDGATQ